jgi:Viral BACON domain
MRFRIQLDQITDLHMQEVTATPSSGYEREDTRMHVSTANRLLALSVVFMFLLGSMLIPAPPAILAAQPAQQGTSADTLVGSGVTNYTVAAPKVFWYTSHLSCPPALREPAVQGSGYNEIISRVAVQGSPTRQIYNVDTGCRIYAVGSNIVADSNYLYWTNTSGLVRLSVNANPGDLPQVLSAAAANSGELAIDSDTIYAIQVAGSSPNYTSTIRSIKTANGTTATLTTRNTYASGIQVSHSFFIVGGARDYVYWSESGTLERYNLNTSALDAIASTVTTFDAEGGRTFCFQLICGNSDLVYFSTGNHVFYYSNSDGVTTPIYTSPNTSVRSITTDANNLFMIEEYFIPCANQPCFGGTYTDSITRRGRGASGTTDTLYTGVTSNLIGPSGHLTNANGYLLWQDSDSILRLPVNAAALPQTNMRVTGLEITQGIQKPDNSVILIAGRRTFVRVFVKSDGAAVAGVPAVLQQLDSRNQVLDSLLPINSVGTSITVGAAPQRANLNDSFLFELPWSWISSGLRLQAVLNPYHAPPQASYANNTLTAGPFSFNPSPALKVQFIAWQYDFNNTVYSSRFVKDIIQTYSWILRTYPLASKLVFDNSSTPGFHPNLWFNWDSTLGAKVNQTDPSCQDLLVKNGNGTVKSDNRNLCASRYTDIQMDAMRTDNGISASRFFYGFISDGLKFPRGQACCAPAVSSGPAGAGTWGWDTDGSYADWYAGHEIGHTLGRGHPAAGGYISDANPGCGHSRDDPNYPYSGADIGATDASEGFDPGDPSLGIPAAIYPGTQWHDVMSYCNNQWISDYTYKGMYDYMIAHPSLNAVEPTAALRVSGDFLSVAGTIITSTNSASIVRLRHATNVASVPARTPGAYSIRLFNAANSQLADYPFTPADDSGENQIGALGFSQVVDFVAGTRQVTIVRLSDGTVLTSMNISSNPPVVSQVALQNPPNPVTGTVTLGWSASDPDGDQLTFDVFYSRDAGVTWQPVRSGVTATSVTIDTAQLGGSGSAILRVVASDSANTGQADSAPFTVAAKPPTPLILTPGNGTHIHFGQLVNFNGTAIDPQDGGVTGAGLVWSSTAGSLGTGEQISSTSLPVGTNVITLTATNSASLSASATVTVTVDDDLGLPGPTLSVGPTRFDWQFAAGATTVQTQTLHVSNVGADTVVNWTASSDATWLNIAPTSGTAPGDITLTVDPAAITDGSYLSATLTLTLPAGTGTAAQTLHIPLSASKGFSFINPRPSTTSTFTTYLPLVQR